VTTRHISIPVIGDRVPETTEVVELQFSNLKFVSVDPAMVLIDDDDVQEGFTISEAQVTEPSSGTSDVTFEVGLLGLSSPWTSASVAFETHDGSATAPVDYAPTAGVLAFDPAHTRRTVTVPVKASPSVLSPRTFHVDLSSSSGPPIVRARGTASIFESGLHLVTPCRLFDSRRPEDGPPLAGGKTRTVVVGGECGLPASARAVALNVTTVGPTGSGYITVFPSGGAPPLASTLNFSPGQTRANNAVVALGVDGWLSVLAGLAGEVDLIVDVTGFFE
jgi:hypothetical protein